MLLFDGSSPIITRALWRQVLVCNRIRRVPVQRVGFHPLYFEVDSLRISYKHAVTVSALRAVNETETERCREFEFFEIGKSWWCWQRWHRNVFQQQKSYVHCDLYTNDHSFMVPLLSLLNYPDQCFQGTLWIVFYAQLYYLGWLNYN